MGLSGVAPAAPDDARDRVVYHIDDPDPKRQRAALNIVRNHLNDVGDEQLDVRVVVQGHGVSMLVLPEFTDGLAGDTVGQAGDRVQVRIDNLKTRGVRFTVCNNSLERRQIDARTHLYDVEDGDIVSSGLAELVRLQRHGYTYIKP